MSLGSFMKKLGNGIVKALPIAEMFFPQLEIVERLAHLNGMSGADKKKLAFDLFSSKLLDNLLPDQVDVLRNDPVFNQKVNSLIDDTIGLENYIRDKFAPKSLTTDKAATKK